MEARGHRIQDGFGCCGRDWLSDWWGGSFGACNTRKASAAFHGGQSFGRNRSFPFAAGGLGTGSEGFLGSLLNGLFSGDGLHWSRH